MQSLFPLILTWIHLSKALLLPLNTSILRLPSQDTILAPEPVDTNTSLTDKPWPPVPYERYIKDGLSINITAYGDRISKEDSSKVLLALNAVRETLQRGGKPDDVLDEITVLGVHGEGGVYVEIGFYALSPPPAGMQRWQAACVLRFMWRLVLDFFPAREIVASKILLLRRDVALFRLSFRVG
ncbi:hypothetical protein BDR22DRAFT_893971 [Usnea florida]